MEETEAKIREKELQNGNTTNYEVQEDDSIKGDNDTLDMLNLFVKELREPIYRQVPNKNNTAPKPCTDYTRTYLPNGSQVALKTFTDQMPGVKKLFIEDWKRVGY